MTKFGIFERHSQIGKTPRFDSLSFPRPQTASINRHHYDQSDTILMVMDDNQGAATQLLLKSNHA